MPDFVWIADDEDGGHGWFSAPDEKAAMVQAYRECIGYFDHAHVPRMVIGVWYAADDGDEVGTIEFSVDRPDVMPARPW